MSGLEERLADMVSAATDGQLSAAEVLGCRASFAELGVSSLALLRLADALEEEFGLQVDLGDPAFHHEGPAGLAGRLRPADV
ncbi:phosphopantetheine-binding protein [Streptomyces sp. NPDC002644]